MGRDSVAAKYQQSEFSNATLIDKRKINIVVMGPMKSGKSTMIRNFKMTKKNKGISREVRINDFLGQFIEDSPGPIINHDGKTVGEHRGLHRYTLGQRKGIGVPSNTDNKAYVVVEKDYDSNALHVAFDAPSAEGLWQTKMDVVNLHYAHETIEQPTELLAKPRYRDPSTPITFTPTGDRTAKIVFKEPQRALASGQVVALYNGPRLVGGGFYR